MDVPEFVALSELEIAPSHRKERFVKVTRIFFLSTALGGLIFAIPHRYVLVAFLAVASMSCLALLSYLAFSHKREGLEHLERARTILDRGGPRTLDEVLSFSPMHVRFAAPAISSKERSIPRLKSVMTPAGHLFRIGSRSDGSAKRNVRGVALPPLR